MNKEEKFKATSDDIRDSVAKAYGERVVNNAGSGCSCGGRKRSAATSEYAGYGNDEMASIPAEAAENSFGCGNPVALSGIKSGDVVLDLGSGAGIDLFLASKKVGPSGHVIGIDMTDEMVALARANIAKGNYTNVEVIKGVIEEMPVKTASVDWVISNCVINLSPEKPKVFREIARVLKSGGQMLVSDIVAHDLPKDLMSVPFIYSSCIAGAIPEAEYLDGLRGVGLENVAVRARLSYDADQLYGIVRAAVDDNPSVAGQLGGCCAATVEQELRCFAKTLESRIQSIKVYAKKPR